MEAQNVTLNFEPVVLDKSIVELTARFILGYTDEVQNGTSEREEIIDTGIPILDEDGKEVMENGQVVTQKSRNIVSEPVFIKNPLTTEEFCEKHYKSLFNEILKRDYSEAMKRYTESRIEDMQIIK